MSIEKLLTIILPEDAGWEAHLAEDGGILVVDHSGTFGISGTPDAFINMFSRMSAAILDLNIKVGEEPS